MCSVQRLPFAPELVLAQQPPPYTLASIVEAGGRLGLKCALRKAAPGDLPQLPLPCLVALRRPAAALPADAPRGAAEVPAGVVVEAAARWIPSPLRTDRELPAAALVPRPAGPAAESTLTLALLTRASDEQVLVVMQGTQRPVTLPQREFQSRYLGLVLLFAAADAGQALADPDAPAQHPFSFRWFVPELLRHRGIWRDVLFASLAIQLMALATPLFTQVVIDKVIVHQTLNTLVVIGVALAIFIVFTAAMTWVRQYLVLHTGNRIDAVLATQVFGHLLMLPPRYFEQRATGVFVARLHGVETIREFLAGAAVTLLLDVPFLCIFLAIMFWYSVPLTLLTIGILGVIVVLSLAVTPTLRARLNQQFLLGARNQAFVTEYVSGIETVKSLAMEPQLRQRFGDYLAAYLAAGFATKQIGNTYNVAANALEQLLTLAILCTGAWLVMSRPGFTIGMLVAFQMFASRLSQPMLRMVGLWQQFQQADIAVKRLGDLMDAPAEPYSSVPARQGGGRGHIDVRSLAFRYGENRPWLYRDLNLALAPGECVALMGPSGSGKSTLAKLLLGFYQPAEGAIFLDGHDIRHLAANELRAHFGVVPQETILFSGTIYDNLLVANPHASFEQVIEVCRMAEIHEVVEQLPQGYQTPIGEHGAGLSGGQKQRIAIARALLKRPRVLIFDEATSNLDAPTAQQLALTLNRLKGKVSILFIAHQLPRGLQTHRVVPITPAPMAQPAPASAEG